MEPRESITVVLADDQPAYREGLARAIVEYSRLELVGVARDGEEALEAIVSLEPDVALVDVRMPGIDGATLCEGLRSGHPGLATRVILMSAQEGPTLGDCAARSGADGFVAKDSSRREICEALVRACHTRRGTGAPIPLHGR
jgi:two-component system, NarL family, nitrate/nitrite response regulator NarL